MSRRRKPDSLSRRLALVVVLFAGQAIAAPDPAVQQAKALYDNGVTDYNLGHFEDALVSFEQAYRLRHDPAFLFNIGQCERQLGRYEDAERSYKAYLRETTDLPPGARAEVETLIAQMRKAVEQRKPTSTATANPAQARPQPTPRQPQAATPAVDVVRRSDDRGGRTKLIAGVTVAAFGVASIAAGGGFYAAASAANDRLNHPANGVYSESAEHSRDTFQSLDIAAFVVGGVAVVTGTTLAVLGWRQRHRVTALPVASNHSIGATLDIDF